MPSLWLYIKSLGGDASFYGFLIASFWVARCTSLIWNGSKVDNSPFETVFKVRVLLCFRLKLEIAISINIHILTVFIPQRTRWGLPAAPPVVRCTRCARQSLGCSVSNPHLLLTYLKRYSSPDHHLVFLYHLVVFTSSSPHPHLILT